MVISKTHLTNGFDFIECFTTTFLRAHSWLNWVDEDDDEDEVGLKEKPEDTRYIKKISYQWKKIKRRGLIIHQHNAKQ